MLKRISLLLIIGFGLISCTDDSVPDTIDATGMIQENPANYQNCGFVINVDGQYLKPTYLPGQYEIDSLEARFTYVDLKRESTCQEAGFGLKEVRLIQIRR